MAVKLSPLLIAAIVSLSPAACNDNGSAADAGTDTDADVVADSGPDGSTDTETDTDSGPGDTAVWVAAGGRHSCAVIAGGYVKCWGDQTFGQLGYGHDLDEYPDADRALPSTLPFVDVGALVEGVDGGGLHTCSALQDGDVKCWGYNGFGQLGVAVPSGTIGLFDVPADHAPIDFGGAVVQLSAGGSHSCVLLDGGDVKCWGDGQFGQLGYGSSSGIDDAADAESVEIGSTAYQISAGARHTCAVLENGDLYCWGQGGVGALGYGDTENVGDDEGPADVGPVDIGGPAVQVACGTYHTCALLESGEVICWGLGDYGVLGYGNTDTIGDDEVPSSVGPVDVGGDVVQISSGTFNTCVLLEGGGVKCWGSGGSVPLGYGNTDSVGMTNVPADVGTIDLGGLAVLVDNGYSHMCALLESGDILCWGAEGDKLGYGDVGDIGDDETPAEMGDVLLF